jgi:ABC-type lipoprotein export system ATPase subunit
VIVVAARGLVKTYGSGRAARRVLDGAGHRGARGRARGRRRALGSGKSTLLHLLGRLDRPEAGSIEWSASRLDGRRERELTRVRRDHVGFVFQAYHLVPELTGEENVLLPTALARQRPRRPSARARAHRAASASTARRRGCRTSSAAASSSAWRWRARSCTTPSCVLADEPTGNLDAEAGAAVLALLRGAPTTGAPVVLVTHEEAATERRRSRPALVEGRLEP